MKITITTKPAYAEEGQVNPLRWMLLSGTPATDFINESAWLKCKDFFNDFCVAYNGGEKFSIFGFNTVNMKIPAKGEDVWMLVKDVKPDFPLNMGVMNEWLKDNGHPTIPYTPHNGMWLLQFDPFYFKNTYNISLISLIIRIINVDQEFKNFDEVIKFVPVGGDASKWGVAVKKNVFFNLPKKFDGFTWYINEKTNSSNKDTPVYQLSSLVHNNGLISWSANL